MLIRLLLIIISFFPTFLISINQYPLSKTYHKWASLDDSLLVKHQSNRLHSDIEIIGYTDRENLPLYAFHIHKSEQIRNKKNKIWEKQISPEVKKILIIGQHHGEEPVGVEISMNIIKELTGNQVYENLIENYYFVIIPTINPEAFRIVNDGIYPLKRKNNSDTNENNELDLKTDGVDLNKNYPVNWEEADLNDPKSPYFKGFSPASESEVKSVIRLGERFSFDYAFMYHSSANGTYPEVIFFPYKWHHQQSKDWDKMLLIASELASYLPKFYDEVSYDVHTGVTSKYGYARDFLYINYNTFTFTIETSPVTTNGISLFFPDSKDLQKIVNNNTRALFKLLQNLIE